MPATAFASWRFPEVLDVPRTRSFGAIAGRDGGIAFRHAGDGGSDYRHRLRGWQGVAFFVLASTLRNVTIKALSTILPAGTFDR